ncbi:MAG: T9SS type A sorting domain-containing protein [Saprospiraceae bacterium]|nr:T9SS type A sorting domain-containing protein [Saprospiraceae bacterium]
MRENGFFSAGVRLLLQVSLLNQSAIQTNINILNVASVNSSTTLTNVSIYIDVARGDVSVDEVNSSGNTVDLSVQPGLARAAIGTIPINNFFNRAQDPFASLDFATIGNINVDVDFLLLPDVNVNLGLQVKGLGDASPGVLAITRGVPFGPETIGSSSTVIATLLNDLTVNSTYQLTPNSLGAVILNPLIVALKNSVGTVLFANNTGIVYNILANVADPLLNATGIGIGQVIIGSAGIAEVCFDFDDTPNIYNTLMSSGGPFHQITPNLYLGTQMPNADADGMPGVMGQPADNDGPDDGLVASYGVVSGNNYSLTVVATNNTGMDALLVAWIDFDGNGSFEANESSQVIVGQGTNQSIPLSWIIADTVVASSYIRARISTDPVFVNNPSTVGFCTDGEVEGELITFAILPVTLLKFDGQKLPDHNMLTWIVENEENFYGFQIERSKDAAIFTSVGFIPSSKNQRSGRKIYTFTDADGSQSNYYYRLKMVDLDEKFTYSKIIYLDGSKATGFDFYPNPASNQVRIDINGTDQKDVLVEIFDFSGKMVLRNKFTNFDDNLIDLDIDLLDQGMYILSITHGTSQAIHKKLLIQK